jgi:hypothetical protein
MHKGLDNFRPTVLHSAQCIIPEFDVGTFIEKLYRCKLTVIDLNTWITDPRKS